MNYDTQQGSITIGLVFGLGLLGLGIAASTLLITTSGLTNSSATRIGVQALTTADTAGREGVYRVLEDYAPDNLVTFTGTVIPLINNTNTAQVSVTGTWPIFEIRSLADNAQATRKTVTTLDLFPSAFAFNQAVYTHGDLSIEGSATVNGDVYATDGIDFVGAHAEVDGDAFSPNSITPHDADSVTGDTIDNHPVILPPTINIASYLTTAQTDGTYYGPGQGNVAASIIKNSTVTGTYYIEDDADIQGNTTDFTGVIVVTNNLNLQGGTYTAGGSNPLALYVTGDLDLKGGVTINGIVYVGGTTTVGGGGATINGALISVNDANALTVTGNFDVTYDPTYADAWNDIVGLETDSGTDPQIKNWHEE